MQRCAGFWLSNGEMRMNDEPLQTRRLSLRRPIIHDYDAYTAMWSDPEVLRHIAPDGYSPEQMWARFLKQAGCWHYLGFGYFTMVEKASGQFVGQIGFQEGHRDLVPSIRGTLEAGWTLVSSAHGNGYASEAAEALFGWGSRHFAGRRAACFISPDNPASLKIAERLQMIEIARPDYHGERVILFERSL